MLTTLFSAQKLCLGKTDHVRDGHESETRQTYTRESGNHERSHYRQKKKEMRQRVNVLQLVNNIAQTHIHYIMLWNLEKRLQAKVLAEFFIVSQVVKDKEM